MIHFVLKIYELKNMNMSFIPAYSCMDGLSPFEIADRQFNEEKSIVKLNLNILKKEPAWTKKHETMMQ